MESPVHTKAQRLKQDLSDLCVEYGVPYLELRFSQKGSSCVLVVKDYSLESESGNSFFYSALGLIKHSACIVDYDQIPVYTERYYSGLRVVVYDKTAQPA